MKDRLIAARTTVAAPSADVTPTGTLTGTVLTAGTASDPMAGSRAAAVTRPVEKWTTEYIVKARDAAVLDAIRNAGTQGVAFQELRRVMPDEPDLTDDQARQALSNTLTRLRAKQLAASGVHDQLWRPV